MGRGEQNRVGERSFWLGLKYNLQLDMAGIHPSYYMGIHVDGGKF